MKCQSSALWECQYSRREAQPPNPGSPPENDPEILLEREFQEGEALFSNQVRVERQTPQGLRWSLAGASRRGETALEIFSMKQKPPSGPRKHTPPCLHVDPCPKGQTTGWTPGKSRPTPSQHQAASHGTVWREEWADIQNQTPEPLCQHPLVPDRPTWH